MRNRPELKEQKQVARWLKQQKELGRVLAYTATSVAYTPYQNQININTAAGFHAGYPDLTVCLKDWLVFIEMKSAKGVVKPEQKHWNAVLNHYADVRAVICYSAKEAIDFLTSLIGDVSTPDHTKITNQERDTAIDDFSCFVETTGPMY